MKKCLQRLMNNIANTLGKVSVPYKGPIVILPFTNIPLNKNSYSHIHILICVEKPSSLMWTKRWRFTLLQSIENVSNTEIVSKWSVAEILSEI